MNPKGRVTPPWTRPLVMPEKGYSGAVSAAYRNGFRRMGADTPPPVS